jgi:hypothetical protein
LLDELHGAGYFQAFLDGGTGFITVPGVSTGKDPDTFTGNPDDIGAMFLKTDGDLAARCACAGSAASVASAASRPEERGYGARAGEGQRQGAGVSPREARLTRGRPEAPRRGPGATAHPRAKSRRLPLPRRIPGVHRHDERAMSEP